MKAFKRCLAYCLMVAVTLGAAHAPDISGGARNLVVQPIAAESPNVAGAPLTSLVSLLNADGTLNLSTGFNGSVDVQGWTMRTGADGTPRFVRAAEAREKALLLEPDAGAEEGYWDGRFDQPPGVNGAIKALTVSGSDVYVGGVFTTTGSLSGNRIARWDSRSGGWTSLANGVNNTIWALAVSGNDLYVGGDFTQVCANAACSTGSLNVNHIARWDGASWSALGLGVSGPVYALAARENDLYVGGNFTSAGGLIVNHIAQWDGANWSALGNGVNSEVWTLAVSGSNLYMGGLFTQSCGNTACNSGNVTVNFVAQWNGANWSTLGHGVNGGVNTLVISGSALYAGGFFTQSCGNAACNNGNLAVNRIAQWNGSDWSALGNGVNGDVWALAVNGSDLYVSGNFMEICGNTACNNGNLSVNRIAHWNGASWSALSSGMNGIVYALAVSGSDVYASGAFIQACGNTACNNGNLIVNRIAQWNGANWLTLGNGVSLLTVNALAVIGSNVYVGGNFTSAGGLRVNNIAHWDGANWSALDNGLGGVVHALAVSGTTLYVGGDFTQVCDNAACTIRSLSVNHVAQWNGVLWSALGSGVNGSVHALAVSGSNVYVGGWFWHVCGNAACNSGNWDVNNIARWDGASWSALGNGVYGFVYALAVSGSTLYVGGDFMYLCDNANCSSRTTLVNRIAQWDGVTWSALGSGVNSRVYALAASGSKLYVGGNFTHVCGGAACTYGNLPVNNIVQWDGVSWSAFGNGVNGLVSALVMSGNTLSVGGWFTQVCGNAACSSGNQIVNRIAQWNGANWSTLGSGVGSYVNALVMNENNLYVGGEFTSAGGKPSYYFGRWVKRFSVYLPLVVR